MVDPDIKYGKGDKDANKLLANLSAAIARVEKQEIDRAQAFQMLNNSDPSKRRRFKRAIKEAERNFFTQRTRLVQLLNDIHQKLHEESSP